MPELHALISWRKSKSVPAGKIALRDAKDGVIFSVTELKCFRHEIKARPAVMAGGDAKRRSIPERRMQRLGKLCFLKARVGLL
ncbi:hypothetical protein KCP77_22700 [Salmonella enterica subsp. enterica]|nr:hypothetical protein KCP77_22700 [Salmonella enterica subsp. enterica]